MPWVQASTSRLSDARAADPKTATIKTASNLAKKNTATDLRRIPIKPRLRATVSPPSSRQIIDYHNNTVSDFVMQITDARTGGSRPRLNPRHLHHQIGEPFGGVEPAGAAGG